MRNLHPPYSWLPIMVCSLAGKAPEEIQDHTLEEHRFWVHLIHLAVSLPATPFQNADKAVGPVVRQCEHIWKNSNSLGTLPMPLPVLWGTGILVFLYLRGGLYTRPRKKSWLKGEETLLSGLTGDLSPPHAPTMDALVYGRKVHAVRKGVGSLARNTSRECRRDNPVGT